MADAVWRDLARALEPEPSNPGLLARFVAAAERTGERDAVDAALAALARSGLDALGRASALLDGLGVRAKRSRRPVPFAQRPQDTLELASGEFDLIVTSYALLATHGDEPERAIRYAAPSLRLLRLVARDAGRIEADLAGDDAAQRAAFTRELEASGAEVRAASDAEGTLRFGWRGLDVEAVWLRSPSAVASTVREERWTSGAASELAVGPIHDVVPAGVCALTWRHGSSRRTFPLSEPHERHRDVHYTAGDLLEPLERARELATRRPTSPEAFVGDFVELLGLRRERATARSTTGRTLAVFRVPASARPLTFQLSESLCAALAPALGGAARAAITFEDGDRPVARLRAERARGAPIDWGPFESAFDLLMALEAEG